MGLIQDFVNYIYKRFGTRIVALMQIHALFEENERIHRWEEKRDRRRARRKRAAEERRKHMMHTHVNNKTEKAKTPHNKLPSLTYCPSDTVEEEIPADIEEDVISIDDVELKFLNQLEAETKLENKHGLLETSDFGLYDWASDPTNIHNQAAFHWFRANAL